MNWIIGRQLILENINVGDYIDPNNPNRIIIATPTKEHSEFRVQIGAATNISISLEMLEAILKATIANKGIYNKSVIYQLYPRMVNNHGCHVHVVGRLFSVAGVMQPIGTRNYTIVN
ncbi:hypothetical protein [Pedobacter gandavensis]|uniref:hypothetical protein n=1 Tax=Pedobacter gandavensis TaxID=2679963 RepID=UPI00292DECFB|nr:hypothetical protein [Pedobacter gandavensis]